MHGLTHEQMIEGYRLQIDCMHADINRLKKVLSDLRKDICDHATDTVWVDDGETAVDRISHILGDGDWYNEVYMKGLA